MVIFAVHLNQLSFEIPAYLGEDLAQALDGVSIEDPTTIFGHEDQMHVHLENTVSSVANVLGIWHRPKYNREVRQLQAFRYELRPNGEQARNLRRFAGSRRFVYNRALALQKARYERGEKKLGYAALCKELTAWRNSEETPWLSDAPVHPLQQSLRDLERAYTNFFEGRAEFPRFKKKGLGESFRYPDPLQFRLEQDMDRIFLPKLGWVRYRNSRGVVGEPKNVTIRLSAGRWFISIQTEREIEQPVHPSISEVGIDVGIANFVTLTEGDPVPPANAMAKHRARLAHYQRVMARRQKFGKNWNKAKAKVLNVQRKIADTRRDFLHKTSTTISKNHAVVYIEDLQVKNMSASAAGTVEKPGRSVKAKSGLNRSILDQGWGEFRRQLGYKLEWRGGELVPVPPHYTSQTCPNCGHVSADNRKTQAVFRCVRCCYGNHADLVGAINILRAGQARRACQASGAVMPPATGTRRGEALCAAR
jgi:putative transposase